MSIERYRKLLDAIEEAKSSGLLNQARELSGYSGDVLVGTLQRFAKLQAALDEGAYLEVGVYQGLTLISVASVTRDRDVFGIDNFAQFDPGGINEDLVKNRVRVNELENVHLINADYEDALENLGKYLGDNRVGVYFVDGPHDYRSQLVCLNLIKPYLSENPVIIVDDCNYRHVRLANRDFLLANPEFKLLYEAYTPCHPGNMSKAAEQLARKGWWNGVNIIVRDRENVLNAMLPITFRGRQLYENEHIVHSMRYGAIAPEAVSFFQAIFSFRFIGAAKQLAKIGKALWGKNKVDKGQYEHMNTYSDKLPVDNPNSTLR